MGMVGCYADGGLICEGKRQCPVCGRDIDHKVKKTRRGSDNYGLSGDTVWTEVHEDDGTLRCDLREDGDS